MLCCGTIRPRLYHILHSTEQREAAALSRRRSEHLFIVFSLSIHQMKEDVICAGGTGFFFFTQQQQSTTPQTQHEYSGSGAGSQPAKVSRGNREDWGGKERG